MAAGDFSHPINGIDAQRRPVFANGRCTSAARPGTAPHTSRTPFRNHQLGYQQEDPFQTLARPTSLQLKLSLKTRANARSLHIATKFPALRLVAKHRLLKVLQHSYITVETTATRIVTEIHRARFVRVQTLLVTPLNITSHLQLKGRLRLQSDKTLNSKGGV